MKRIFIFMHWLFVPAPIKLSVRVFGLCYHQKNKSFLPLQIRKKVVGIAIILNNVFTNETRKKSLNFWSLHEVQKLFVLFNT